MMMRQNPLPAGRYSVDVFEKYSAGFRQWLNEHKRDVSVVSLDSNNGTDEYVFDVAKAAPWKGPGFPTVIAVESLGADPSPAPLPPKSGLTGSPEAVGGTLAKIGMGVLIAGVLVGGGFLAVWSFQKARSTPDV